MKKTKKIEEIIKEVAADLVPSASSEPAPSVLEAPATEPVKVVLAPKKYEVPVTREDLLALHKCLKDLGVNSIGDLEVRASKL